jgi:hypothetical protein
MPAFAIVLTLAIVPGQLRDHPRLPENLIRRVVQAIVDNPAWTGKRILVAPDVEGAVIAEFAILDRHRPGYTLLRPGKVFADRDWIGGHYKSHFQSMPEMVAFLRENPVDLILWHRQVQKAPVAHQRFMEEMLAARDSSWFRVASFGSASAQPAWEIYEPKPSP